MKTKAKCKKIIYILLMVAAVIMIGMLTACSSSNRNESETHAISNHSNKRNTEDATDENGVPINPDDLKYVNYVNATFVGEDPWGGIIKIKVTKIKNQELSCTYKDVIDNYTINVDLCDIELEDDVAIFGASGVTAEDDTVRFNYVGTLELKDDTIILHYQSGDLFIGSAHSGSYYYNIGALSEEEKIITLHKE